MNEFTELLKIARNSYSSDEEIEMGIDEHVTEYGDTDRITFLMATAFFAGMLYQKTDTESSIAVPVTADDAFQIMQSLVRNNEVKLTLYVEEKE